MDGATLGHWQCFTRVWSVLETFEQKSGETANLSNIGELVETLTCFKCESKSIQISDDNDRLLFAPENVVICVKCGLPIARPRLQSLPGTNQCTNCAAGEDEIPHQEQHHTKLQKSYKYTCETCGKRSVRRKNFRTGTEFFGCSGYPVCKWTHHIWTILSQPIHQHKVALVVVL